MSKHDATGAALRLESPENPFCAIVREYAAITLQELGLRGAARSVRARSQSRRNEEPTAPRPIGPIRNFTSTAKTADTDEQSLASAAGALSSLIVDSDTERHLQFSPDALQSRMRLDDPYALIAPYTRQMMSFLLFNPDPAHVLMIGLGGGSLAKFCYRHLPDTRITVIEIDERVIALREAFSVPPDDARLQVVHDDGVRYLAERADPVDAILVDAYDASGVAPSLASPNFFRDVSLNLAPNGVLVMNLHGQPAVFRTHLEAACATFSQRALVVTVASNDNALLCAFGKDATPPDAAQLFPRARYLQSKLKLHFRNYLQRLREGHVLAHGNQPFTGDIDASDPHTAAD